MLEKSANRVIAMGAPVLALVALAGCNASVSIGSKTITNPDKLVSDGLAGATGKTPKSVTCPRDVEAKVGKVFHCKVVDDAGIAADASVTETSISGDTVHVQISVAGTPATSTDTNSTDTTSAGSAARSTP